MYYQIYNGLVHVGEWLWPLNDLYRMFSWGVPRGVRIAGLARGLYGAMASRMAYGKLATPRHRDPVKPGTRNSGIWNNGIIIAHAQ